MLSTVPFNLLLTPLQSGLPNSFCYSFVFSPFATRIIIFPSLPSMQDTTVFLVSSLFGTLLLLYLSSFNMGAPFYCTLTFSQPPYMCSSVVASTLGALMIHPWFILSCSLQTLLSKAFLQLLGMLPN